MQRLIYIFLFIFLPIQALATNNDFLGVDQALFPSESDRASGTRSPRSAPEPLSEPKSKEQNFDYSVNMDSNVFGAQLFTGAFAREGATRFNPDYAVAIGDRIQVRFWGAFEHEGLLTVDPKGNIFLPHVGPVQVLGVRNQDLQRVVDSAVSKVFRANVNSYASLAAAQPVRVFVSGFVRRPGLYNGTSMDSLLHYLDKAGGIDAERGSFLKIQVKRGDKVRTEANLYEFLLAGRLPLVQLADGDVIFVTPRQNTVKVFGLAENANSFEFAGSNQTVADLMSIAKPLAQATHARVVRNTGTVRNVEYFPLSEAAQIRLQNGDELEFTADKKPGTISVRVEGEHESAQEYVLAYGATIGDLMTKIEFSRRSDVGSIQLFRRSVKERQKDMLDTSLKSLENAALTARSGTSDEARLRKEEADLILQWVDRARKVEPKGQVLISESGSRDNLVLENGDLVRIPAKDGLVLIGGEVLFPNAVAFQPALSLQAYIQRAGGYAQNADASRVIIAHRDGSFSEADMAAVTDDGSGGQWWDDAEAMESVSIRPGDEILILPKIDVKSRQITMDLTQILYQIAISAKVVLGL